MQGPAPEDQGRVDKDYEKKAAQAGDRRELVVEVFSRCGLLLENVLLVGTDVPSVDHITSIK